MIREAIGDVVAGRTLDEATATAVMNEIMSGEATPAQLGAFLVALRLRGETVEELAGFARVMREKALRVSVSSPVMDTCGTGGDGAATINVSTAAAFVAAAAGARVGKHGNRAMSSRCGSADVLEALGVKIDLGPEAVARCIDEVGMGFMFAPGYHPAMRFAAGPRREIGVRTVFNLLGPMTNPAGARSQVLGVPEEGLTDKLAQVLLRLECDRAMVVYGLDGLDEFSVSGPTGVAEVRDGQLRSWQVTPEEVGLRRWPREDVRGAGPEQNAAALRAVFAGRPGAHRDFVLLNAAAALVVGGVAEDLRAGVQRAAEVVDSGEAGRRAEALARLSQTL